MLCAVMPVSSIAESEFYPSAVDGSPVLLGVERAATPLVSLLYLRQGVKVYIKV